MLLLFRNHPDKLPLILFWYDVCDFTNNESKGSNNVSGMKFSIKHQSLKFYMILFKKEIQVRSCVCDFSFVFELDSAV